MTTAEAEAHFRAMGVQIRDDITYVGPPTTEQSTARAAARLMGLRESTVNMRARLAGALRSLEDTKRADAWFASLPVVDIDTWAVEHAPDLIREIEERDGVPHWTTRKRQARIFASSLRRANA